ncbi:MAG: GNAT family N-acetyltransferase [Ginsengibacter sp.]
MIIQITENISLELTSENLAESMFQAINTNREHLSRFLPWVENMKSITDVKEYIKNSMAQTEEKKEVSFLIVSEKSVIGRIGIHNINFQNKNASIGYWLIKEAEGKGIISKATRSLITYAFQTWGLNRIEIRAATDNQRSRSVPERLGMLKEGTLREVELVNGKFLDLEVYSVLSSEWVSG